MKMLTVRNFFSTIIVADFTRLISFTYFHLIFIAGLLSYLVLLFVFEFNCSFSNHYFDVYCSIRNVKFINEIFYNIRSRYVYNRSLFVNVIFTCNFCHNLLVSLQVLEPYKITAFTFDPKILSLVLVVSVVHRHIGLSIANACLALPIRAWMSSSMPPFLLTMLPR